MQQPQTKQPTPPVAPVVPAAAARSTPSPSAIYEGLKAQRDVLTGQLHELDGTRNEITGQMEEAAAGSPEHKALEDRLTDVDGRIKSVDQMLAGNSMQLAQAAAVPGAVVPPPPYVPNGPPDEVYVLAGIFMFVFLLPLSVAFARRIWRRSAVAVTTFPRELADRLLRLEQTVEATSLEVERIGEGQRFLTRLFTEGEGARAIGIGAAQPVEKKLPQRNP
ncbi:MAG TPA: hypothetical protein VGJ47_05415 [Gemmatimonadaceae bacterium]